MSRPQTSHLPYVPSASFCSARRTSASRSCRLIVRGHLGETLDRQARAVADALAEGDAALVGARRSEDVQLGLELSALRGKHGLDLGEIHVADHLILAHRLFLSAGLRLAAWQGRSAQPGHSTHGSWVSWSAGPG